MKQRLRQAIHPPSSSQPSQPNVSNVKNTTAVENDHTGLIKIPKGPVFKRIPKASRLPACIAYTKIIQNIIDKNDIDSYGGLVNFARCAIGSNSGRGGKKKKSQATILNKRIEAFMAGTPLEMPMKKGKKTPSLKNLVSAKMALADITGALRILTSEETILPESADTLNRLKEKHPPLHNDAIDPPIPDDSDNSFKTNKDSVLKAIHSFKKGAAGGPDGFLPQHLIDMCGEALGEPASKLVNTLVNFLNLIVFPGKVPTEVAEMLYGANLIALGKKDGGIRPIAVGFTLRRLAAKIVMHANKDFCEKEFQPHQVGVGTPKGAEAAVHSLRSYLLNPASQGGVLLKIDFKNAFNSIWRDVILELVKSKLPKFYNFIHQCYSHKSCLKFGDESIDSCEGVQQGDPLGPFLFSLGIQNIINDCKSEFNCWYLDDGSLAGDVKTVLEDATKITNVLQSHGLEVNPSKSELFLINPESHNGTCESFNSIMNGIKIIQKSDLTLLGAPIFVEGIKPVLESKIKKLKLMSERLKEIDNHDAFFLLRNALGIPKLTYFLRTAPCFLEPDVLQSFDSIVKESLVNILNISMSESSYDQATLPVASGH